MTRTVWLNGEFVAEEDAKISIFDRGVLFADSIYEGFGVLNGQIVDYAPHMVRLHRSLGEIGMSIDISDDALFEASMELLRQNNAEDGFLYLQITRGVQERNYLYPDDLAPTMFAFFQPAPKMYADKASGLSMQSTRDIRWARRDIKSNNLLGQVMAKVVADKAGAGEALMLDDDGYITEGGSVSFFIVDADKRLYARPLGEDLLPGITRIKMLEVAEELGLTVVEERFKIEDVFAAKEAFVTAASTHVRPVTEVDGRTIGNGHPGELTMRLRQAYFEAVCGDDA